MSTSRSHFGSQQKTTLMLSYHYSVMSVIMSQLSYQVPKKLAARSRIAGRTGWRQSFMSWAVTSKLSVLLRQGCFYCDWVRAWMGNARWWAGELWLLQWMLMHRSDFSLQGHVLWNGLATTSMYAITHGHTQRQPKVHSENFALIIVDGTEEVALKVGLYCIPILLI